MADVNGLCLFTERRGPTLGASEPRLRSYGRVKIYDKSRREGGFHQPRERRVTFDRNIFSRVYPDAGDFHGGEKLIYNLSRHVEAPRTPLTDG